MAPPAPRLVIVIAAIVGDPKTTAPMAVPVTMPIMVHATAAVSTTAAAAVRMLLVAAAVTTATAMTGTCGNSHGTERQTGSHRQHGGRKLCHRFLIGLHRYRAALFDNACD
jgi:hypothetical protein